MEPSAHSSLHSLLAQKTLQHFLQAARNFCALIESCPSNDPHTFLQTLQKQLLALYTLGLDLPSINVSEEVDLSVKLSDPEMNTILKSIGARIPFSYYWVVLNPADIDSLPETGMGDLCDDLGDMYKNLKEGLLLFEQENNIAKENAIWQFKFDFDYHWNTHCMEALQAIFQYLSKNKAD